MARPIFTFNACNHISRMAEARVTKFYMYQVLALG